MSNLFFLSRNIVKHNHTPLHRLVRPKYHPVILSDYWCSLIPASRPFSLFFLFLLRFNSIKETKIQAKKSTFEPSRFKATLHTWLLLYILLFIQNKDFSLSLSYLYSSWLIHVPSSRQSVCLFFETNEFLPVPVSCTPLLVNAHPMVYLWHLGTITHLAVGMIFVGCHSVEW